MRGRKTTFRRWLERSAVGVLRNVSSFIIDHSFDKCGQFLVLAEERVVVGELPASLLDDYENAMNSSHTWLAVSLSHCALLEEVNANALDEKTEAVRDILFGIIESISHIGTVIQVDTHPGDDERKVLGLLQQNEQSELRRQRAC